MSDFDYDLSAIEAIEHDEMRGAVSGVAQKLSDEDPEERWNALDALKMLAKQNDSFGGSPELRAAVVSLSEQVMSQDPEESVVRKASHTHVTISQIDGPSTGEMAANM